MRQFIIDDIDDLVDRYKDIFAERLLNVGLQFCPYDVYKDNETYKKDNVVYCKNQKTKLTNFFTSLVDDNTGNNPYDFKDKWALNMDINYLTYITDEEIKQHFLQNANKIHYSILACDDKELCERALFLMTSCDFDIQKAKQGGSPQLISSQSAEGYSVSFDTSKRDTDTALHLQSTFGVEYQNLINACTVPLIGVKVGDY